MSNSVAGLGSKGTRSRLTAHEFVRETLPEGILDGSIAGGTRLVQADLAGQLRVSTTPVREALRDLAAEGMIELDAHRGATVHTISPENLSEVYELRCMLEVVAIEKAARRITADQLDEVRVIVDRMQAANLDTDWVMLHRDFHTKIYEAANSPRLRGILRKLLDATVMYVSVAVKSAPLDREHASDDHSHILRALENHDAPGAVAAIKHHLEMPRTVQKLGLRG